MTSISSNKTMTSGGIQRVNSLISRKPAFSLIVKGINAGVGQIEGKPSTEPDLEAFRCNARLIVAALSTVSVLPEDQQPNFVEVKLKGGETLRLSLEKESADGIERVNILLNYEGDTETIHFNSYRAVEKQLDADASRASLPDEVWSHIAEFLPKEDRIQFSLTDKRRSGIVKQLEQVELKAKLTKDCVAENLAKVSPDALGVDWKGLFKDPKNRLFAHIFEDEIGRRYAFDELKIKNPNTAAAVKGGKITTLDEALDHQLKQNAFNVQSMEDRYGIRTQINLVLKHLNGLVSENCLTFGQVETASESKKCAYVAFRNELRSGELSPNHFDGISDDGFKVVLHFINDKRLSKCDVLVAVKGFTKEQLALATDVIIRWPSRSNREFIAELGCTTIKNLTHDQIEFLAQCVLAHDGRHIDPDWDYRYFLAAFSVNDLNSITKAGELRLYTNYHKQFVKYPADEEMSFSDLKKRIANLPENLRDSLANLE